MIAETRTSGGFVGEFDRSARDLEGIGSSVKRACRADRRTAGDLVTQSIGTRFLVHTPWLDP